MDKEFALELADDLEHMRQLLERCVRKLRAHAGTPMDAPATVERRNDIRTEIERHRQAVMAQVEGAKAQALQAAAAMRTSGMAGAGGPVGPGLGVSMPGLVEELHRKLAEQKAENGK